MDCRDELLALLDRADRRRFCDACLALELHVSLVDMRAIAVDLAERTARAPGECSVCRRTVEVNWVPRSRAGIAARPSEPGP